MGLYEKFMFFLKFNRKKLSNFKIVRPFANIGGQYTKFFMFIITFNNTFVYLLQI